MCYDFLLEAPRVWYDIFGLASDALAGSLSLSRTWLGQMSTLQPNQSPVCRTISIELQQQLCKHKKSWLGRVAERWENVSWAGNMTTSTKRSRAQIRLNDPPCRHTVCECAFRVRLSGWVSSRHRIVYTNTSCRTPRSCNSNAPPRKRVPIS